MDTKIAIVAGHNPTSQGVIRKKLETSEWLFARELIEDLKPLVKDIKGIDVKFFERRYMGRKKYGAEMRDLHGRIDRWGANISVEMHFNASESKAKGHEVLHYSGSKGGRIIATTMDKAFDNHLKNRDRQRKPVSLGERGSYGLKVGRSKSILTEPFFAKELPDFIRDGKQRPNLISAYIEFLEGVANLDNETKKKNKVKVTHKTNFLLTDAEYAFAMKWLGL